MTYRGYNYIATYNGPDQGWSGKVVNSAESIIFEADTFAELAEAFREVVDEYLDACALLEIEPSREGAQ